MAYRRKTQEEVLLEILGYISQNTNGKVTDFNVGSVLHALSNALANQVAGTGETSIFSQLDELNDATHVDTAEGEDLEQIAALFGLTRQSGLEAEGTITFRRSAPSTSDFTISSGSRVATTPQIDENQKVYEVNADTTFYASITGESQLFTDGIYNYPLDQRFIDEVSEIEATISSSIQVLGTSNYQITEYDDYVLLSNSNLVTIDEMETNEGWENSERVTNDACDATSGWSAGTDGAINLNNTSGEYIEGTGSLQLDKTGTTTDTVLYSKTLGASVDLSLEEQEVHLVVDDLTVLAGAGTVIEVRVGTDSSNYYYKEYTQSDFDEGEWKSIKISSTNNDGDTGAPTANNCPYIAVNITYSAAGTTASNDIRMDYWNYYVMPVVDAVTYKQGSNSLQLFKTTTSSDTVSFYKTFTPSVNTYGLYGFIWFYIDDTDTLNKLDYVSINSGTNSSNYFTNIFYRADLSVGWNALYCVDPTQNGVPSSSQTIYEQIDLVTNNDSDTIAAGKINIDWFVYGDIEYYKGDVVEFTGTTYPDDGTNYSVNYVPLSAEVDVTAIDIGYDYNVSSNKVTYLLTPNSNITNINNYNAFSGGTDEETDDVLRIRIKNNAIGLGLGTEEAIKSAIENVEGVASANVTGTPLTDRYGPSGGVRTMEAKVMDVASAENVLDYEMIYLDDVTTPTNIIVADDHDDNVADWDYGVDYTIDLANNKVLWLDTSTPGTTCPTDSATYYIGYQYNWIGHIQIYVAGDEIPMSTEVSDNVDDAIDESKSAGDIVSWSEPSVTTVTVTASITVSSGYGSSTVSNNVKSEINTFVNSLDIGEDVAKNNLIKTILNVDGVETVSLSAPTTDVSIDDGEIARISAINITVV
jgi:uncharacterized phage protein gp47/JayE